MNKEISEEPSIEPQVQGNESIEETQLEHNYSTRSKERKREEELQKKSQLKQKQHNVVIHPRLKPVPFKNLDLNPASLPEPNAATTINEIEFFKLKIYH